MGLWRRKCVNKVIVPSLSHCESANSWVEVPQIGKFSSHSMAIHREVLKCMSRMQRVLMYMFALLFYVYPSCVQVDPVS
jgi:hypothetical protein